MAAWGAQGSAELEKLAIAYRAGERKIRSRVARRLREAATPLAREVVEKGSEGMPVGGGLRDRLASSKGSASLSLLGKRVSVGIRIGNSSKDRIRAIDRTGQVRHPVYGTWRKGVAPTSVPQGSYTDAFAEGAPAVRKATAVAVQEALIEIAREASSP